MKRFKKWSLRVALGLAALALFVAILAVVFQERLLFFPFRYPAFIEPGKGITKCFIPYTAEDGKKEYGCLIEPKAPAAAPAAPEPRFYMVYLGNGSVARDMIPYFQEIADATGCSFFSVDYRGYGFNEGKPSETGLTSDGLGAYDTMKGEGRFEKGVGVIGLSMGGGVAYAVAEKRPVDRLITMSTYTSLDDMARRFSVWPVYLFMRHHFPNAKRLAEIAARPDGERPKEICIMHGKRDKLIPFRMGEALAATPGKGIKFYPYEKAVHFDIPGHAMGALKEILASEAK